jgi:metal-dependent amidase/aminoacylase/carboxypeptidase family protein
MHAAVLTIGTVQAGTAANVIPEQVVLTGSLRTFDPADRASLWSAVSATQMPPLRRTSAPRRHPSNMANLY